MAGTAIGTALIVPGDEALAERVRAISDNFSGEVGVSAWNGFAMIRVCAQECRARAGRYDAGAARGRCRAAAAMDELRADA